MTQPPTRTERAALAVLGLLLTAASAGCGARVAPGPPPSAATRIVDERVAAELAEGEEVPALDEPSATGEGAADSAGSDAAPAEGATPGPAGSPSPTATARASHHNNGTVRLHVTPSCARPGGVLQVTFTGPPHADVNGVVVWPDGSSRFSDRIFGRSDANGHYLWPLAVPVDTRAGEGTILGGMTGTDRYGSADAPFTIAPDC